MIADSVLLDWMKADESDLPTLRRLEQAAIQSVQQKTGRYYGVTATITEELRFRGFPLTLSNTPIGDLTSLEQWNGSAYTAVDATSYSLHDSYVFAEGYWNTLSLSRFRATYEAGYTVDPDDSNVWDAPADIQQAVLLLVGHWFENRESVVVGQQPFDLPQAVDMLLAPHVRATV